MTTDHEQEQNHGGEDVEPDHVEFRHPSPGDDSFSDEDATEGKDAQPNPATRYVVAHNRNELDEDDTVVDRAGPTLTEVQSLGPIEEMEVEMFDKVERESPIGSGTMKQVFVCKFCDEAFPYMVRDMHTHKNMCTKYPGRQGMVHEVRSVPDDENPELSVDIEVVGEVAPGEDVDEDVQGPDAPVIDDEYGDGGDGDDAHDPDVSADMGREEGQEQQEDEDGEETQMLDDEPSLQVVVPDRVELPSEHNESRPTLKVARTITDTNDVDMDEDSEPEEATKPDELNGDDATAGRSSPGNASETASTGSTANGRDTYRSSFRMFSDADGEHAECLQCGKVCSHRGSAMAAHFKKCPASREENRVVSQQSITPKKKSAKRRISGLEFDALEEDAASQPNDSDADSNPGSPPLRRSKRFRSDSNAAHKQATDMESLVFTESMADTATTTSISKRSKPADVSELEAPSLAEFDLLASGTRIKCKHCELEMAFRAEVANQHLGECDAYMAKVGGTRTGKETGRLSTSLASAPRTQKRTKATERVAIGASASSSVVLRHPERLQPADILEMDHDTAVTWMFGSQATVERIREHYGKRVVFTRSSASRFRAVETALCGLNVQVLLAQLPATASISAVIPGRAGDSEEDAVVPCASCMEALPLYSAGAVIMFPAPTMVANMFVPHLAKELKCSNLVATEMHRTTVCCARASLKLNWQYHKTDIFVVWLRGKASWRLEPSPVQNPPSCFHLVNPPDREDQLKMQVAALGVGSGQTSVGVPATNAFDLSNDSDQDDDMGENSTNAPRSVAQTGSQQVVTDAGGVLYIPAGTWHKVEATSGQDGSPVWVEFQVQYVRVGDIVADVVRQLVLSQDVMRARLSEPSNGDNAVPHQQVLTCARKLGSQLMELSANEILPEPMFSTDSSSSAAHYVGTTRVVEYDLTDPNGYQGGRHINVYKGSMFRVNPLAVVMRADELAPPAGTRASGATAAIAAGPSEPAAPTSSSSKKALNRKSKRSAGQVALSEAVQGSTTPSRNGPADLPGVFLLYFGYSGVANTARLKVQFRCNPAQGALVEWIRARDTTEAFHVSELAKVLSHVQGGSVDTELLKGILRFLCTTGYIAAVNVPL